MVRIPFDSSVQSYQFAFEGFIRVVIAIIIVVEVVMAWVFFFLFLPIGKGLVVGWEKCTMWTLQPSSMRSLDS